MSEPVNTPRYIDMTPEGRREAFDALLEARANFCVGLGSAAIARSRRRFDALNREITFLARCSRSQGDGWLDSAQYQYVTRPLLKRAA